VVYAGGEADLPADRGELLSGYARRRGAQARLGSPSVNYVD
jgi:hypothetical protein